MATFTVISATSQTARTTLASRRWKRPVETNAHHKGGSPLHAPSDLGNQADPGGGFGPRGPISATLRHTAQHHDRDFLGFFGSNLEFKSPSSHKFPVAKSRTYRLVLHLVTPYDDADVAHDRR